MRTPARLSGTGPVAAPLLRNEGRASVRCSLRVVSPGGSRRPPEEAEDGPIEPDGPRARLRPDASAGVTGGPSGIRVA